MKVTIAPISAVRTGLFAEEWTTIATSAQAEKPKVYLDFITPPLALVIAMQEAGEESCKIYDTLRGLDRSPHIQTDAVITKEHIAQADEIYKYFSRKHSMRRLNGKFISEWVTSVEDLCENRLQVDIAHIPILVTLPKFYNENRELESLMKKYKSIPINKARQGIEFFDEDVTFVKKIERRAKDGNFNDYYWSTKTGYLVRVRLKTNNMGSASWDYIASKGKIHMRTEHGAIVKIPGYNFFAFQPSTLMEVVDAKD